MRLIMASLMWFLIGSVCVLIDLVASSTSYSNSLSITDDYYASVTINVGTPEQSLSVLLDTTSTTTFVFTSDTVNLTSSQDYFTPSDSSSYQSSSSSFTYTYENATVTGSTGTDTIDVGGLDLTGATIGLGSKNQDLFETESLGGALSLSRNSDFINSFLASQDVETKKFLIDIASKALYFGDYTESSKNSTQVSVNASEDSLTDYWAFAIDSFYVGTFEAFTCDDNCYGVIDAASPYLTFSMSSTTYKTMFSNIGGSGNCQMSTLTCDDSDSIADYVYFTIGNDSFYMDTDDYYYDSKLHLLYEDELVSGGMVIFFGRPWLETLTVAVNAQNDTLTFSYTSSSSSSSDKWQTVWIVAICVGVFACIFFGVFFYKFKIPPPTQRSNNEEQVAEQIVQNALLQGQPIRAQPHQPLGPPGPGQGPGQPTPQAQLVSEPAQAVGSATGAAQSNDPDEIRRRRLQFLESQQQQAEAAAEQLQQED